MCMLVVTGTLTFLKYFYILPVQWRIQDFGKGGSSVDAMRAMRARNFKNPAQFIIAVFSYHLVLIMNSCIHFVLDV